MVHCCLAPAGWHCLCHACPSCFSSTANTDMAQLVNLLLSTHITSHITKVLSHLANMEASHCLPANLMNLCTHFLPGQLSAQHDVEHIQHVLQSLCTIKVKRVYHTRRQQSTMHAKPFLFTPSATYSPACYVVTYKSRATMGSSPPTLSQEKRTRGHSSASPDTSWYTGGSSLCKHTHTRTHTHTRAHTHMYTYTHVYLYARTHAHTRIHTCIYVEYG